MGEARRRGTWHQRRAAAIKLQKKALVDALGGRNACDDIRLRSGIEPFLGRMSAEEWGQRRSALIAHLKGVTEGVALGKAQAIRVQSDEIAWYLFVAEQALEDPLCMDVSQAARNLPYLAGLGERWQHRHRVSGLEAKIDEILGNYKSDPDGLLFEVLVALSYAAHGWNVEFLDVRPPEKSPDIHVRKEGREFMVECKRQSRRPAYAEAERNTFLRLWDSAREVLVKNGQWLWFNCTIHIEVTSLPENFLTAVFARALPLCSREAIIYDGPEATVLARKIDRGAVQHHLASYLVKQNSPTLSGLLGGDWAPPDAEVTMIMSARVGQVADCEAPALAGYVEDMEWACGMTRTFAAEASIEKKARDVKNLLADAVKQVPQDMPSIIHIAVETLEGRDVEIRRTEKVMTSIPSFITDRPVAAVRLHRFQPNQTTDKLWEFDETVEFFQRDGVNLRDIPDTVVLPLNTEQRNGYHWEWTDS